MPTWLRLRRLRGPAFLVLFGITALLNQWAILRFSRSWPLYLILAGLFGIAERAALGALPLSSAPYVPAGAYAPGYGAPAYATGNYAPAGAYAPGYGAGGFPHPGSALIPTGTAPNSVAQPGVVSDYEAPALSSGSSTEITRAADPERRS